MPEAKNTDETQVTLNSTDLAFERTALAYERTLMAWMRTAVSMISFGFTIYKFLGEVSRTPENQQRLFTPRVVGIVMISFGLISLLLAQLQHQQAYKKLRANYPQVQKSLSSLLGVLILVFGLLLFFAALFRQ